MADINLTQAEADMLIAIEKHRSNDEHKSFPMGGESLVLPLHSADKREQFLLDLSRGRINLSKVKMQNRGRQIVVLVRVDLGGPPHCNPDESVILSPHIHVYREGYGVKWAITLPTDNFRNPDDVWTTYEDVLRFCNITHPPYIERGLFT